MRKALLTTGVLAAAVIAPSTVAFADSPNPLVELRVVAAASTIDNQVVTQKELGKAAAAKKAEADKRAATRKAARDAAAKARKTERVSRERAAAHDMVHGPWKDEYGKRVNFRGFTLNARTAAMVREAEHDLGHNVQLAQGSYNAGGVAASAGTHDGGGVLDVAYTGDDVVAAFRKVGFAAWHRTPAEGFSPHIHAVAVGDPTESYGAKAQVDSFQRGRNGLAGDGPDTFHN